MSTLWAFIVAQAHAYYEMLLNNNLFAPLKATPHFFVHQSRRKNNEG